MFGRILIAFCVVVFSAARAADPKDLELSEALTRRGFTDSVLDRQPKMVVLGVAQCSAEHLLCEGERCLTQLDACLELASRHTEEGSARALSSTGRPQLKKQPKASR